MHRYREKPPFMEVSMLCPGISQNTKLHHLTLYKGQVWEEKPFLELCNNNVLNIAYGRTTNYDTDWYPIEQNGELNVPPVPSRWGFIRADSQIAWDSEILESFAELTDITNITFHYFDAYEDSIENVTYQIQVGGWVCFVNHNEKCVPPTKYWPWFIWTKEGFKIQIKIIRFKLIILIISIF